MSIEVERQQEGYVGSQAKPQKSMLKRPHANQDIKDENAPAVERSGVTAPWVETTAKAGT